MPWPFASPASGPTTFAGPGAALPTVAAEIGGGVPRWVLGMHFINKDVVARRVIVTDSAGHELFNRIIEADSESEPYEAPFRPSTGLKWVVDTNGLGNVLGQVWGY